MILPEESYSTSSTGTLSHCASAVPSSTGTPRGLPVAGSRTHQSAEAAGPTAIPTRSLPVGASSVIAWSATAAMSITPKNTTSCNKQLIGVARNGDKRALIVIACWRTRANATMPAGHEWQAIAGGRPRDHTRAACLHYEEVSLEAHRDLLRRHLERVDQSRRGDECCAGRTSRKAGLVGRHHPGCLLQCRGRQRRTDRSLSGRRLWRRPARQRQAQARLP